MSFLTNLKTKYELDRKLLIFKQNVGYKKCILTPEQINDNATPVFGYFREPLPIYNDKGDIIRTTYVFEPLMYRDEDHPEVTLKYLDGDFFTLDNKIIWNMYYFDEHGKDEPTWRRYLRFNYYRIKAFIVRLAIPILIGLLIYQHLKGGK